MIASPDLTNTRSRLADWLELRALFSNHGAGEADLASIARLTSDDHRDREIDEAGTVTEDEILELGLEETIARVSEEAGERSDALGAAYPFVITKRPFLLTVNDLRHLSPPQWTYLFLLLMSAYRDKSLPSSSQLAELVRVGRTLFHACASVGVAGLLRNGHTFWFGFPRPEGTNFLAALEQLCSEIGYGKAKDHIPPGLPERPQDDELDVVGWPKFRKQRYGNLIVLCQAATGDNWDTKSIIPHIQAFKAWFVMAPYALATPSIALPFPAHHEVSEHPEQGFQIALYNALARIELRNGVVIDRLRIVESVLDAGVDEGQHGRIAGIEKIDELKAWVSSAMHAISSAV
jgi:hypothetical protein